MKLFTGNGDLESSTLWNLVWHLSLPPAHLLYHLYCNIHPIYLFALLSVSNFLEDGLKKRPTLWDPVDMSVNPRSSKLHELRKGVLRGMGRHLLQGQV